MADSSSLEEHVLGILETIDPEPRREGLERTPDRVARALTFLTRGYGEDPRAVINGALFTEEYSEMIVVKDIDFYSLCEHHILPFFGRAHVAYIPRRQDRRHQQDRATGRGVRAAPPGAGAPDDADRQHHRRSSSIRSASASCSRPSTSACGCAASRSRTRPSSPAPCSARSVDHPETRAGVHEPDRPAVSGAARRARARAAGRGPRAGRRDRARIAAAPRRAREPGAGGVGRGRRRRGHRGVARRRRRDPGARQAALARLRAAARGRCAARAGRPQPAARAGAARLRAWRAAPRSPACRPARARYPAARELAALGFDVERLRLACGERVQLVPRAGRRVGRSALRSARTRAASACPAASTTIW